MPLSKWQIKPGYDKQNSEVGAVARYVGGDNVRFRYSLPEKVGGWKAEGGESISSVVAKEASCKNPSDPAASCSETGLPL